MKSGWLAGLALLSLHCQPSQGCTSWEDQDVAYVLIEDPQDFSSEQLDHIQDCLDEWETALNGSIRFELVTSKGPDDLIVIRASTLEKIQDEYGKTAVTNWVPWERGGGIIMPADVGEGTFHRVLLHELGHALGLDHDETPGSIMQPALSKHDNEVTCRDVEQFCSYNDCSPQTWPICAEEASSVKQ